MSSIEAFLSALVSDATVKRESDLAEEQLAQISDWDPDDAVPVILDVFSSLHDDQDDRKIGVLIVLRALLSASALRRRSSARHEHAATTTSPSFSSTTHLSTLLCVSLFLSELSTTTSDLLLEATANAADALNSLSRIAIHRALYCPSASTTGSKGRSDHEEETRSSAESLQQELHSLRDALTSSLLTDDGDGGSRIFFGKRAVAHFLGSVAVEIVKDVDACGIFGPLSQSSAALQDFRTFTDGFERSVESLAHMILATQHVTSSLASSCVALLAEVQRHLIVAVADAPSSTTSGADSVSLSNARSSRDAASADAVTKLTASFLSIVTRAVHKEQLQQQQFHNTVLSALRFSSVRRGMRLVLQGAVEFLAPVLPAAAQQTVAAALEHCGGRVYPENSLPPPIVRICTFSATLPSGGGGGGSAALGTEVTASTTTTTTATVAASGKGKVAGGKGKKKSAASSKNSKPKVGGTVPPEGEEEDTAPAPALAAEPDAGAEGRREHRTDCFRQGTIDVAQWNAKFKRLPHTTIRAEISGRLGSTHAAESVTASLLQLLLDSGAGHGGDGLDGDDDAGEGEADDGDEDENHRGFGGDLDEDETQQIAGTHLLPGVGRVLYRDLAAMVIGSLQQLPVQTAIDPGRLEKLHLDGIQHSQRIAAKNAQLDELLRLKRQEELDVEEVPAGKLLTRVPLGAARSATQQSAQLLSRETARAALQRRIFLAVLKNFHALRHSLRRREDEGALRAAQALTARVFAQLPQSVTDSALDVLCQCLHDEVHDETSRPSDPSEPYTVFSLIVQILYLKYSLLAPVTSALGSGVSGTSAAAAISAAGSAPNLNRGTSGTTGGTSAARLLFDLHQLPCGVSVENPVGWIASGDFHAAAATMAGGAGGEANRKRSRASDDSNDPSMAGEPLEANFFTSDNAEVASAYSHCLRRCITVLVDSNRADWVLELLLECPAITPNTWSFLLQNLCLGERLLAPVGIYCVSILASKRRVYRNQAVSLLLFLCGSAKSEPRRLAIAQLAKLVDLDVLNEDHEGALVSYAVRLLARLPLIRTSKTEPTATHHDATGAAVGEAAERKAQAVLLGSVDRHMGLFLMLCAQRRHTKNLLPSLFNMIEECERQDNGVVASVALQHPDLPRFIQQLLKHPHEFVMSLTPVLRRFGGGGSAAATGSALPVMRRGSEALVQLFFRIAGEELRSQATSALAAAVQQGGEAATSSDSSATTLRTLEAVATILLTQAHALFMQSKLPVPATATGRELTQFARDIRYVVPFLGLVARAELKPILVSLMQYTAVDVGYDERELRSALRELLVKHPLAASMPNVPLSASAPGGGQQVIPTADGSTAVGGGSGPPLRGLSLSEFVVQLHEAAASSTSSASAVHGAAVGGSGAAASAVVTPSMLRSVLSVATRLTRTFDLATATPTQHGTAQPPLLFDVKDALRAIQQLFRQRPMSSNFMSTVDVFCRALGDHPELVYYTVSNVLQQFARDATWENDAALWRGVLSFCEDHWSETHQFVVNLPDRVLVGALRSNSRLGDIFRATYGSNPAFSHVMAAVSMQ